ncbi:MAG: calcium/sodium antiporter [Deinococcota bacterium]
MTILVPLGAVIIGIAALIWGSNFLIDNASILARRLGVSSLLIGLTVVAFGTSAPELAASIASALEGLPDLAMGNVIGSNTANLALVMAVAGLIYPLTVDRKLIRRDVIMMLATSILIMVVTWDGSGDGLGRISRLEGFIMVGLLLAYVSMLIRSDAISSRVGRKDTFSDDIDVDDVDASTSRYVANPVSGNAASTLASSEDNFLHQPQDNALWKVISLALVGIALLVGGANVLVYGASVLASQFGISERVIGVTVVAVGTSLPELASCIAAALKRQADMIVGNLVGSNIFNVLSIIGITSAIKPLVLVPESGNVDFWVMLGVSALTGGLLVFRPRFGRRHGLTMLSIYSAYISYIALTRFAG